VEPDAYRHSYSVLRFQTGIQGCHGLDELQARLHGPLRLVFMGLGIAEVHQQPIAEVLRHIAIKALDHGGRGLLIGADDGAVVFGVELARELCRVHQITEHHRQVPTFGFGGVAG
jgi:hypothetical protein